LEKRKRRMSQDKQKAVTKKSRIPEFKSYAEEAQFWDTHDFTEFEDETHPVDVHFTKTYSESVQVRFDPDTNRKLEELATERGLKKSTLIRNWIMERLQAQGSMPPKTAL
jgi:GH43 family beta-xylosidase